MRLKSSQLGRSWAKRMLFVAALLIAQIGPSNAQSDEKLQKKIEKLHNRLVKAFEQLAMQYDELKDPKAAHFLAECPISCGSKDEKVKSIRTSWETLGCKAVRSAGRLLPP